MDGNSLDFTAIRGVQAGSAYYAIMVPLKVVPRLFKFDDEAMPATLRAQRTLNKARVPEIASYITGNPNEYILSSLCASVDGEIDFEPAAASGHLRGVGGSKPECMCGKEVKKGLSQIFSVRPAVLWVRVNHSTLQLSFNATSKSLNKFQIMKRRG